MTLLIPALLGLMALLAALCRVAGRLDREQHERFLRDIDFLTDAEKARLAEKARAYVP